MLTVAIWICSVFSIGCTPQPTKPDLNVIQTAYDHELSTDNRKHDANLKVLETTCEHHRTKTTNYLCQVTFMSTADPTQRLYFDVVAIEETATGWELKSGLCKR